MQDRELKEKLSKVNLFLELAKPDKNGFSREVSVEEFTGKYAELKMGNGGDWCRNDGSLGKKYNIRKRYSGKGNKIISIELHGYQKNPTKRAIKAEIQKKIKEQRCVVLGTGRTECDHKDGRLDDPRVSNVGSQKLSDFQPLSKAANVAKRQHCKECKDTGNRFDATRLGFKVSQIDGNGKYRGSCVGCYWHDPKRFHGALDKVK